MKRASLIDLKGALEPWLPASDGFKWVTEASFEV